MPIHLRAEPDDYAPAVLCPGDPRRAEHIATTILDDARCVNDERGMLGFTGTYDGAPLSVQSTGMGCPSAAIVFEELVQLGARRLVRVGTCGALQPDMAMADLVCALAATPHDGTALSYTGGDAHAPTASWPLVAASARLAGQIDGGAALHVGPIVTSDVYYDTDVARIERWASRGHLAIEMETAVLYTIAALRGVEAVTLLTVSDILAGGESRHIDDADLRAGVDAMVRLAAAVAISAS